MKKTNKFLLILTVLFATSCAPSWKSAAGDRARVSVYSNMISNCKGTIEECQNLYNKTYGGCSSNDIKKTNRCWDEMTATYH